ncbi:unnamed protein product [Toxocara canis]|uniref:Transmembrane protein n=1 Tax=Toxocara canis TaxID=6265 RepID=A0A183UAH5_TOXCA|nr:unnamed protein product [Toxocara canis]
MADHGITIERQEPLGGVMTNKLCFIPSRQTGIVSLIIQLISLLLSAALVILLVMHVEGQTIFGGQSPLTGEENSSNEASISLDDKRIRRQIGNLLDDNATFEGIIIDLYSEDLADNSTIHIGENGPEVDLMELLRISSMVYIEPILKIGSCLVLKQRLRLGASTNAQSLHILQQITNDFDVSVNIAGMCILWLLSLFSLLASIKLENLDLAVFNAIILCIVMIYAIIHALFVSILFFYLHHVHWKTVVIIGSVIVGLFTTSIFCAFALALIVAWYRYVVYVNDSDQCQCLASIVSVIKGNAHKRGPTNEYSIPEATRQSQIPYGNDSFVQQFSHF